MSTDTTDDVNQSNDGEPANLPPHGIRGFLTAYYVYILIAAGLCLLEFFGVSIKTDPIWSATALLKFAFFVFAAKSLKRIGTAWVRNLHIALNGVLSIAVIAAVALNYTTVFPVILLVPWSLANPFVYLGDFLDTVMTLLSIAVPLAWTGYWLRSKRVKNTYVASEATDDEILDAARSSKKAWLIATQLAGLLVVLPWLSDLPFALRNIIGERGINPGAVMVATYPAWFAVLALVAWGFFKGGKYRISSTMSVIPIFLVISFTSMGGGFDDRSELVADSIRDVQMDAMWEESERQRAEARRLANPEGPFTRTYPSGQKKAEGRYDDQGNQVGLITEWYESALKEQEYTYVDGKREGLSTYWWESGQKAVQTTYANGRPDGTSLAWYENGQPMWEASYDNGMAQTQTSWHENGQKRCEASWDWSDRDESDWNTTPLPPNEATAWDEQGNKLTDLRFTSCGPGW